MCSFDRKGIINYQDNGIDIIKQQNEDPENQTFFHVDHKQDEIMKGPKDKIEQLILSHQKKQRLFKSTGKHEDL